MRKVIFYILLIIIFNNIFAEDLTFYRNHKLYKGFSRIWFFVNDENTFTPYLFSPNMDKIYFSEIIENGQRCIKEVELSTKKTRIVFNPYNNNTNNSIIIRGYYIINSSTMICITSEKMVENDKGLLKMYYINMETKERQMKILDSFINISSQFYHKRNTLYSPRDPRLEISIYIFNDDNTYASTQYILPDDLQSIIDYSIISLGRSMNEIFVFYKPHTKNNFRILFYDIEEENIIEEYDLNINPINNTTIIFTGGRFIKLLPNEVDILISDPSSGIWIYKTEIEKLYNLIYWESWKNVYVCDVSWDSSKILISSRDGSLYLLDINEFLENHPNGEEIFFPH